jgi:hypothetical protein
MTQDKPLAFPISKEGLLAALDVAIALLPGYGTAAWEETPDGCQLDVGFAKGYLERLRENVENETCRSVFPEPVRKPND